MRAAGSQTRVAPEDFRISTRVFISKVRQTSGVAPSAGRHAVFREREAGAESARGSDKIATVHEGTLSTGVFSSPTLYPLPARRRFESFREACAWRWDLFS